MAYGVMVYIVMAYIFMVHLVVAYVVLTCNFTAYIVRPIFWPASPDAQVCVLTESDLSFPTS